jgi:hypothetical protein
MKGQRLKCIDYNYGHDIETALMLNTLTVLDNRSPCIHRDFTAIVALTPLP